VQLLGEALDGLKGHVALAALDRPHIRAVHSEEFGELLLREAEGLAMASEIVTNRRLKVTDHAFHGDALLLMYLQTYE